MGLKTTNQGEKMTARPMTDARAYPHDLEAERALLGQSMSDPDALGEVRAALKPEHFYRPGHRNLFAMLCGMADDGTPIDTITMIDRMRRDGGEYRYGGVAYVVELVDGVVSTANAGHYARIVRDKYIARTTLEQMAGLRDKCLDDHHNVVESVAAVVDALNGVLELGTVAGGISAQDASDRLIKTITSVYKGEAAPSLRTGFPGLDQYIGLKGSDLCIVAARPGTGKTAFALSLALGWAGEFKLSGKQVVIFSLEMPAEQLIGRLAADVGSVSGDAFRQRPMSHDEYSDFIDATNEIRALPITIYDRSGMSIQEMRAQVAAANRKTPVGVVIVDYVQLIRNEVAGLTKVDRIGEASKGCKAIAKDLDVPVVLLAQINRAGGAKARPGMDDLKGAGDLEEDADQIILMSRPGEKDKEVKSLGLTDIEVVKNRHGATGLTELHFDMEHSRFEVAR